jgi:hypothetical protein
MVAALHLHSGLEAMNLKLPDFVSVGVVFVSAGLFWAGNIGGLAAEGAPAGPAAGGEVRQIALEYQEAPYVLDTFELRFTPLAQAFKKEPEFGAHRVVRGALGWGTQTNQFTPFAWDHSNNRLYLDQNRNLDLTDDSDAVYAGQYEGFYQEFPGVRFLFHTPAGARRYFMDLRLGGLAASSLRGQGSLRSFWQAKVEFGGRPWQLGLVENPNATWPAEARRQVAAQGGVTTVTTAQLVGPTGEFRFLVVRPWAEREEPMRLNPGTPHLVDFCHLLYLAGQAWELNCRYASQASPSHYVMELVPQQPPLGELRLSGMHLFRVILMQSKGYTVILDKPGAVEKAPAGTYEKSEVWLRKGAAEACDIGERRVSISPGAPTTLSLGGPLSNVVAVTCRQDSLVFDYRLVGADGHSYRLSSEDREHPPAWSVYRGGQKLASGSFQYG